MAEKRSETLFAAGKARWLLDNVDKLDEDQRALLLALAELGKDTGRDLTEDEKAALDKLAAETQGFDASEIQSAVQKMVKAKTKRETGLEWPAGLSRKVKRSKGRKK